MWITNHECVIQRSGIYTKGSIYHLRHQNYAFFDNIALITKSRDELKKIFKDLALIASKVRLQFNEGQRIRQGTYYVCNVNGDGQTI